MIRKTLIALGFALSICSASAQINVPIGPGGGAGGAAGTGTVTSIATACGVSGGPITTTGTISGAAVIRAATGTTDTILSTDCGKVVTESNAAAVAVTLPQATGAFTAPFFYTQVNLGAGTVTITPTTSTINGAATLVLTTGQSADISSDGTNYVAALGKGGGSGTVTTTGSPASGNLARFSGTTSVTNDNLSADCTTSGTLAITCPIAPPILSGNWYAALPDVYNMTAGSAHNANRIFCRLQIIPHLVTINSLGAGIGTAGTTNVQFALYANTNNRPGALIGNTGNISNAVSANTQVSGAMAVNKQVGPGGADGGPFLWFCSNQNDSTATYAVGNASSHSQDAMTGDPTLANLITGPANGAGSGVNCLGAGCTGGSSTFGSWPATLAGSTWNLSNPGTTGNIVPVMFYKVN